MAYLLDLGRRKRYFLPISQRAQKLFYCQPSAPLTTDENRSGTITPLHNVM